MISKKPRQVFVIARVIKDDKSIDIKILLIASWNIQIVILLR
jgi:5-deoxy-D-glucuronate isomerase